MLYCQVPISFLVSSLLPQAARLNIMATASTSAVNFFISVDFLSIPPLPGIFGAVRRPQIIRRGACTVNERTVTKCLQFVRFLV